MLQTAVVAAALAKKEAILPAGSVKVDGPDGPCDGCASPMVEAIVQLKAYCIAAKKTLEGIDLNNSKRGNALLALIRAFGVTDDKVDLVTEYARTVHTLQGELVGINKGMLDMLNTNILKVGPSYCPHVDPILTHHIDLLC